MPASANSESGLRAFAPALALLFAAVLINYVDRGNLSIAAPLLKEEWHISPSQLGVLFSAFFWTYTAMQLMSGWLVDRFDVNTVIAMGFLLWSAATAATGLVNGFALLLVMRLLLGVGESVIFPASSKILARSLPESSRGIANGLLSTGMHAGGVVGTLAGGLLMARYGWRLAFLGIGLASLLWLPAWRRWKPRPLMVPSPAAPLPTPRLVQILQRRSFWGAACGHFCGNYLLYFMVTWLPFYLVHEQHLSMAAMSKVASLYFLTTAVSAAITGAVADMFIRRLCSASLVRKAAMAAGGLIAGVSLTMLAGAGTKTYVVFLLLTGVGAGTVSAGAFAFAQTLAGTKAAGRWVGMQNGVANLAGVVGPALTGYLVNRTGHFAIALDVTAAVAISCGISYVFGVGHLEELHWTPAEAVLVPLVDPVP